MAATDSADEVGHLGGIEQRRVDRGGMEMAVEFGHQQATYTLTGPAAITHDEIVTALGAALGRITFTDAPPEQFSAALQGILPQWQIEGTLKDYAHYSHTEAAFVSTAVQDVTGRQPGGIAKFTRYHADHFRLQ